MNALRLSSIAFFASLALAATGLPALAVPAVPATPSASVSVAPSRVETLRLDSLMRYPGPIRLERIQSEATLALPVSKRMAVRSAALRLRASHSASLIKGRSQLSIALNDQIVAQLPLDGAAPMLNQEIPLPVELLDADFNRVTFRVVQHYAASGPESPFAPELWTQIDTARSTIVLDASYRALAPRLADLSEIFSPKEHGDRRVALLSASPILLDETSLRTGSLIAQALAVRLRYVPLAIAAGKPTHLPATGDAPASGLDLSRWNGRDAVLFGTREQVSPFLPPATSARITGPFLGLYPQEGNPGKVMLLVSGRDEDELLRAASVLAFDNFPYPAAPEAVIQHVELPEWSDDGVQKALAPGRTYTFKDLGFATRTLNGFHREEAEIAFFLPPDFHVKEQDKATLSLHYALGAGLEPGSLITVLVNREFATTIRVENQRATIVEADRHSLPMRLFRPGENTLTLATRFTPSGPKAMLADPGEGLLMSLFNDSSLRFPDLPRFTELPNLELLARTGFPHTEKPDGSKTRLWVTGDDPETLSAAYTLVGRLAQTTGLPMFRLNVSFDPKAPSEDLLVVSPRSALPSDLLPTSNVGPVDVSRFERVLTRYLPFTTRYFARVTPKPSEADLSGPLGSRILVTQFESPYQTGRTVTLWTADSAALLKAGMDSLIKPGPWSGLHGAWTLWDPRNTKSTWESPKTTFDRGRLGITLSLSRLASRFPLPFLAFVIGLSLLLALLILALIKQSFRKEPAGEISERIF
ncbi:Cyclic di-GMP-binding protein precursor [compost metagenome]